MNDLRPFCPSPPYRQVTVDCFLESSLGAGHLVLQQATGKKLPPFDAAYLHECAARVAKERYPALDFTNALLGPPDCFEAMVRYGLCPAGTPTADKARAALEYRISGWERLSLPWVPAFLTTKPKPEQTYCALIDAVLDKGQPVLPAIGTSIYAAGTAYWTWELMRGPGSGASHAFVLVDNPPGEPYWFLNSWGLWGLNGLGRVDRELMDFSAGLAGIYTCRAARPVSVPVPVEIDMTPAETQAMIDASLAPIKAQLAAIAGGIPTPAPAPAPSSAVVDLPPAAFLTDRFGTVWTLPGGVPARRGVPCPGSAASNLRLDSQKNLWALNSAGWWPWNEATQYWNAPQAAKPL